MTSARGNPFYCKAATSQEYTGVFSLFFCSVFFIAPVVYISHRPFFSLCIALSVTIWCDIPLTKRQSGAKRSRERERKSKPDVMDNQIMWSSSTCFDLAC